jgi:hypothetical protein
MWRHLRCPGPQRRLLSRVKNVISACRAALPNLDISRPLVDRESHAKFYVDRAEEEMLTLRSRLTCGALDDRRKLVFSGHIGSGKSTELFNLKRSLEEEKRATIIYWSIRDHVNMVGMDATRLLEGMARAVLEWLGERGVAPERESVEERIRRAYERTKRVRKHKEGYALGAGFGPKLGFATGSVNLHAEGTEEQEHVYEEVPDPSAMLLLVNELVGLIRTRRAGDPPVMFICDDLEKLDLKTAVRVFEDGLTLREVDACTLYTVPISLLYSEWRRVVLGHFDEEDTILHLIKVRKRGPGGAPITENLDRMVAMLKPRFPDINSVFSEDALRHAALVSGGVFRDLLRLIRTACLRVVATNRDAPQGVEEMKHAESEIRNSFQRQIPKELISRLEAVRRDQRGFGGGLDPELGRLLNLAAVLEYHNGDTWYGIHPLTDHLLAEL